jgi:hypothetical protein
MTSIMGMIASFESADLSHQPSAMDTSRFRPSRVEPFAGRFPREAVAQGAARIRTERQELITDS